MKRKEQHNILVKYPNKICVCFTPAQLNDLYFCLMHKTTLSRLHTDVAYELVYARDRMIDNIFRQGVK